MILTAAIDDANSCVIGNPEVLLSRHQEISTGKSASLPTQMTTLSVTGRALSA
jgi:hypothetical protein